MSRCHGPKAQSPNPNHGKDYPHVQETHLQPRTERSHMSISVLGISVDAVDAARLANFWAQALNRTADDGAAQSFASIAAQTARAVVHGQFSLGIGLGGNQLEQRAFGIPAGNEIARLHEYLTVLRAISEGGDVDFDGQELTGHPPLSPVVAGGAPFPIYVAAMGPTGTTFPTTGQAPHPRRIEMHNLTDVGNGSRAGR
jgi:hypothetical protein